MEPRRWRPKFFNPFTERRGRVSYLPLYMGFFRQMPLHRWSLPDIQRVLGYAALNPSLFGFEERPTCVVNTLYFVPSHRSLQRGVFAFGHERGCKNLVIPASCSGDSFDAVDVKLIEPLFRWNPGLEYVYLSQSCQPMAQHLAPLLAKCHRLQLVTLEGWDDAVAIHRVVMACKQVETLDAFSPVDLPRDWQNELAVQALTTMIEMHPKLRCVKSHRLFLGDWYTATLHSRCKHNVALVPFSCDYDLLHYAGFLLLLCIPALGVYKAVCAATTGRLSDNYSNFWSVVSFVATVLLIATFDAVNHRYYGRAWVHMHKYCILAKRRVDIHMNVHQASLAKI